MNPRYPAVARRAGHRCEYCHAPEAVFNFPFEVEHIVPRVRQGADADHNLALSCRACNVKKAAFLEYEDPQTRDMVRLYHPRQDDWSEHFRVDDDRGTVEGRTPVGRATVACPHMNTPTQEAARRLWIRLGLFP